MVEKLLSNQHNLACCASSIKLSCFMPGMPRYEGSADHGLLPSREQNCLLPVGEAMENDATLTSHDWSPLYFRIFESGITRSSREAKNPMLCLYLVILWNRYGPLLLYLLCLISQCPSVPRATNGLQNTQFTRPSYF